ncbi:MAG: LLM class flavin-dependent oxidoreductase [Dehalococcoidia bacterium]
MLKRGTGFAVPQVFPGGEVDRGELLRICRRAEEIGFGDLWTSDSSMGSSVSLEPLQTLAYLAAATERVRLGVSVLVLPHRQPALLAKELATLDQLSGGRLIVGVGIGGRGGSVPLGIGPERRVRRFTEALEVMNRLWREEHSDFDGHFFRLDRTPMQPKPLQRPRPPIWFGARAEPALRRAVRLGDGWMGPGSSSADDFRTQLAVVREALEQAERDPASFAISKRLYLAIDDDAERARARLREWFGHNYRNADMAEAVAVWGPAEHCHEYIDELVDAGAEHLLLNPVFDFDEHLEALRRYVA